MPEPKPAERPEEQRVEEVYRAYREKGLAGIKEALHQRNEQRQQEREQRQPRESQPENQA